MTFNSFSILFPHLLQKASSASSFIPQWGQNFGCMLLISPKFLLERLYANRE